jgi:predicted DNA-binding transcriptional regulator AlpA
VKRGGTQGAPAVAQENEAKLITKQARTAAFSIAPDGAVDIAPDGSAGDLIRGWRGICLEARKSRAQLWRDIRAGRFPPPIELGPNSVAWFRLEIQAWKASRPRRTYRTG